MSHLPDKLPFTLPALHVVLFLTTEALATGGNPLFCVNLPVSLPLVASDSSATVVIVGILATAWWYFVGKIACEAWRGKVSRMISVAGALLLFLLGAIGSFAMISEFRLISQEPNFGSKDVVIYVLAVTLLLGNFVGAGYAILSGLRPSRKTT
ncbi:MAG: hypothetical protein WCC99_11305 [Candidatus Sulfotelmatobacter sp.]